MTNTAVRDHLEELESESIFILRETVANFRNPVLLFSGGKDSAAVLHLALKAFRPGKLPFPLLHIDTGHNFPEVLAYRDHIVQHLGVRLIVRRVQDSIDSGRVRVRGPKDSRNAAQAVTLLDAINELGFDACVGGARRDEEKARAKERIFSVRNEFGQWDPRQQRPELWSLLNGRLAPGQNMRVFPLSNWTELDVWTYIGREAIELPTLYFSHDREVVARQGVLWAVSELLDLTEAERIETRRVRFRTVGDMSCTLPVESIAASIPQILAETATSRISERGATRLDDRAGGASMEARKRAGYF